MMKKFLSLIAAFTLSTLAASAADVWKMYTIQDRYNPTTPKAYSATTPVVPGETVTFVIEVLNKGSAYNTPKSAGATDESFGTPWGFVANGASFDAAYPTIALSVGGRRDVASIVGVYTAVSEGYATALICEYVVKPGDLARPLKIWNNEFIVTPTIGGTTIGIVVDGGIVSPAWDQGWVAPVTDPNKFAVIEAPNEYKSSERNNKDLSDSNIYIEGVRFSTAAPETNSEAGTWLSVRANSTELFGGEAAVEVTGASASNGASTLYIWSGNEDIIEIVGDSNVLRLVTPMTDVVYNPNDKLTDNKTAKVYQLVFAQGICRFKLRAKDGTYDANDRKSAKIYVSTMAGMALNNSTTIINSYMEATVDVIAPSKPSVWVRLDGAYERAVTINSASQSKMTLSLSGRSFSEKVSVKLAITYKDENGQYQSQDAADPYLIIGSESVKETREPILNYDFDPGETEKELYYFLAGAPKGRSILITPTCETTDKDGKVIIASDDCHASLMVATPDPKILSVEAKGFQSGLANEKGVVVKIDDSDRNIQKGDYTVEWFLNSTDDEAAKATVSRTNGTFTLKGIEYKLAGDYVSRVTITTPDGVTISQDVNVTVKARTYAKLVRADGKALKDAVGEDGAEYKIVLEPNPGHDGDLYAYIKATDAASEKRIKTTDLALPYAITDRSGLDISSGETEPFKLNFNDNGLVSVTIVLSTEAYYDGTSDDTYGVTTSKLNVNNVAAVIGKFRVQPNGKSTWSSASAKAVVGKDYAYEANYTGSLKSDEPYKLQASITDVADDLAAEVIVEWRVLDNSGNQTGLYYTKQLPDKGWVTCPVIDELFWEGKHFVEVRALDKDQISTLVVGNEAVESLNDDDNYENGLFNETFGSGDTPLFEDFGANVVATRLGLEVTDKPLMSFDFVGATHSDDGNYLGWKEGSEEREIKLKLAQNVTGGVKFRTFDITITPVDSSNTDFSDKDLAIVGASTFNKTTLTIAANKNEASFKLLAKDGKNSAKYAISVSERASEGVSTQFADSADTFAIFNRVPSLMIAGSDLLSDDNHNGVSTNSISVSVGQKVNVKWAINPETETSLNNWDGVTVTWTNSETGKAIVSEATPDAQGEGEFSFSFKTPTTENMTYQIRASWKDSSKVGGSLVWQFTVIPAKTLTLYPVGPSVGIGNKGINSNYLNMRYAGNGGLGEGKVWIENKPEYTSENVTIDGNDQTWVLGRPSTVKIYAEGYRFDDELDENGKPKKVFKVNKQFPEEGKEGVYKYTYDNYKDAFYRDSFFYTWLDVSLGDTATEGEEVTSTRSKVLPDPAVLGTDTAIGYNPVDLPTTVNEDGNYPETRFEAVFSKEFYESDNLGDINQDEIPDWYVARYGFGIFTTGEDGEINGIIGDDTVSLAAYNKDLDANGEPSPDFLPKPGSTGAMSAAGVSNKWTSTGRAFTAKDEIRGYHYGLNRFRRSKDTPQGLKVPEFSPSDFDMDVVEWIAYSNAVANISRDLGNAASSSAIKTQIGINAFEIVSNATFSAASQVTNIAATAMMNTDYATAEYAKALEEYNADILGDGDPSFTISSYLKYQGRMAKYETFYDFDTWLPTYTNLVITLDTPQSVIDELEAEYNTQRTAFVKDIKDNYIAVSIIPTLDTLIKEKDNELKPLNEILKPKQEALAQMNEELANKKKALEEESDEDNKAVIEGEIALIEEEIATEKAEIAKYIEDNIDPIDAVKAELQSEKDKWAKWDYLQKPGNGDESVFKFDLVKKNPAVLPDEKRNPVVDLYNQFVTKRQDLIATIEDKPFIDAAINNPDVIDCANSEIEHVAFTVLDEKINAATNSFINPVIAAAKDEFARITKKDLTKLEDELVEFVSKSLTDWAYTVDVDSKYNDALTNELYFARRPEKFVEGESQVVFYGQKISEFDEREDAPTYIATTTRLATVHDEYKTLTNNYWTAVAKFKEENPDCEEPEKEYLQAGIDNGWSEEHPKKPMIYKDEDALDNAMLSKVESDVRAYFKEMVALHPELIGVAEDQGTQAEIAAKLPEIEASIRVAVREAAVAKGDATRNEEGVIVDLTDTRKENLDEDLNAKNGAVAQVTSNVYDILNDALFWTPERPTSPLLDDTDGDGIPDGYEYWMWYRAHIGWMEARTYTDEYTGEKFTVTNYCRLGMDTTKFEDDKFDIHNDFWDGKYDDKHDYEWNQRNRTYAKGGDNRGFKFELVEGDTTGTNHVAITSKEIEAMYDPLVPLKGANVDAIDTDGDGLPDLEEFELGTNPLHWDSDGDGLPDGWEVAVGLDPLNARDSDVKFNNPDGDAMACTDRGVVHYIKFTDKDGTEKYWLITELPAGLKLTNGRGNVPEGTIFHATKDFAALPGTIKIAGDDVLAVKPADLKTTDRIFPGGNITYATLLDAILIHDQVYNFLGFDYRTAWYVHDASRRLQSSLPNHDIKAPEAYPTNTRAYTTLDEFYYYDYCTKICGKKPSGNTELEQLLSLTTYPADVRNGEGEVIHYGADSDGDGVPDGWEIYVGQNPNADSSDSDTDLDGLLLPSEFAGTYSSDWYANCPTIASKKPTNWPNKFYPTDPGDDDTDGDGISDYAEMNSFNYAFIRYSASSNLGGAATNEGEGEAEGDGNTLTPWEILNRNLRAQWHEYCFLGGGLNPCTVDTDMDGLPDGWEAQFQGHAVECHNGKLYSPASFQITYVSYYEDPAAQIADGFPGNGTFPTLAEGARFVVRGMDGTHCNDGRQTLQSQLIAQTLDPITMTIRDFDFDHDGLDNYQEYLVQALRHFRYDDAETPLMGRAIIWKGDDAGNAADLIRVDPANIELSEPLETISEMGFPQFNAWDAENLMRAIKGLPDKKESSTGTNKDENVKDEDLSDFWHSIATDDNVYMQSVFTPFKPVEVVDKKEVVVEDKELGGYKVVLVDDEETRRIEPSYLSVGRVVGGSYDFAKLGYFTSPKAKGDMAGNMKYMLKPYTMKRLYNHSTTGRGFVGDGNYSGFVEGPAGFGAMRIPADDYVSCDPTKADTDGDGMDDYWELFHGLNPILGEVDIIDEAYNSKKVTENLGLNLGQPGITALNNAWVDANGDTEEGATLDPIKYPWMMGLADVDADGDGLRNYEENPIGNQANPRHYHTDPSPRWMTDPEGIFSYARQYYSLKALGDNWPSCWSTGKGTHNLHGLKSESGEEYMFAFEVSEGFDTDGDGKSDSAELVSTKDPASDPLDSTDPARRQAMYFPGYDREGTASAMITRDQSNVSVYRTGDVFRKFTVECWINPDTLNGGAASEQVILERTHWYDRATLTKSEGHYRANFRIGITADDYLYALFDNDDAAESASNIGATSLRVLSPTKVTRGAWTHVAATYDGVSFILYLNGAEAMNIPASKDGGIALIPANGIKSISETVDIITGGGSYYPDPQLTMREGFFVIGSQIGDDWHLAPSLLALKNVYRGYVDEVRMWDGARTADEISKNYAKHFGRAEVEANRKAVFLAWDKGLSRNENAGKGELPAELLVNLGFETIPAADDPAKLSKKAINNPFGKDLAVPAGFREGVLANLSYAGVPLDSYVTEGWYKTWKALGLESKHYSDAILPRARNTVAQLAPLSGRFMDTLYWGEYMSAYWMAGDHNQESYEIPNSLNPYSEMVYTDDALKSLFKLWQYNRRGALVEPAWNITGRGDNFDCGALIEKAQFDARARFSSSTDFFPIGSAYAKTCETFWDDAGATLAWDQSAMGDINNDGVNDRWADLYSVDATREIVDTDGDGIPDAWERSHGLDPEKADSDSTEGVADVMAYQEVDGYLVTIAGKSYITANTVTVGDTVSEDDTFYATYYYGPKEQGLYALSGEASPKGRIMTILPVKVVLIHNEVYAMNGFNSKTANVTVPEAERVNTKPFTALDKYLASVYGASRNPAVSINLNPEDNDADNDGIPDGWELYVGLNPNRYDDRSSDEDGDNLAAIEEYNGGKVTDPNNANTIYADITDDLVYKYNLTIPSHDDDGDGLPNSAEYLITEVYNKQKGVTDLELDPKNPKSDGVTLDYFRKFGQLYVGEVFTDHDQISDVWENELGTEFANRYVYDPLIDNDHDGWSNYAEFRAGTDASKTITVDAEGAVKNEYPIPSVRLTLLSDENLSMTSKVVVKAVRSSRDYGAYDAEWYNALSGHVVAGPLNNIVLGAADLGYLREGKTNFIAFLDADGDNEYTVGELFGCANDVVVGWDSSELTIKLTRTNPLFKRVNLFTGENDRDYWYGLLTKPTIKNPSSDSTSSDSGTSSDLTQSLDSTTLDGHLIRVRVIRYARDTQVLPSANQEAIYDKYVDVDKRNFLHEGDVFKDGAFDLDWNSAKDLFVAGTDFGQLKYLVVLGEKGEFTNSTEIVRYFDTSSARQKAEIPAEVNSLHCYSSRPTFKWTMPGARQSNLSFNTYPAFSIKLVDGNGKVVYDSGYQLMPAEGADGYYSWTAPISFGDVVFNGSAYNTLAYEGAYKWRLAVYNTKFQSRDVEVEGSLSVKLDEEAKFIDGHNFGTLKANVLYFGPIAVLDKVGNITNKKPKGQIRLEAFESPDFCGEVIGSGYATKEGDKYVASIRGLELGKAYYLRAYLDSDGDMKRSDWESWGYFPTPVTVTQKAAEVDIYLEDCDTDQDWLPDAWEYHEKNDLTSLGGDNEAAVRMNSYTGLASSKLKMAAPKTAAQSLAVGPSDEVFGTQSFASLLLGVDGLELSEDGSIKAKIEDGTLVITGFAIENGEVVIDLDAEISSALSSALAQLYVVEEVASVTVNVLGTETLNGGWSRLATTTVQLGKEAQTIRVELPKELPSNGFYKITIE